MLEQPPSQGKTDALKLDSWVHLAMGGCLVNGDREHPESSRVPSRENRWRADKRQLHPHFLPKCGARTRGLRPVDTVLTRQRSCLEHPFGCF